MSYNLWVFLHVAGVLAFLAAHGVSIAVMFRLRRERDRRKIEELIAFSGTTALPMYASLGVLLVTGVVAGVQGRWFDSWWIWASIGVLLVTITLMTAIAKPYFKQVAEACGMRPTGVPRKSDEELGQLLGGPTFHVINAIGTGGLLVILYLMIFKPGVG